MTVTPRGVDADDVSVTVSAIDLTSNGHEDDLFLSIMPEIIKQEMARNG